MKSIKSLIVVLAHLSWSTTALAQTCYDPELCPDCATVVCGRSPELPQLFCYVGSGCTPCVTRDDCSGLVCCYDMCFAAEEIEACDRKQSDLENQSVQVSPKATTRSSW